MTELACRWSRCVACSTCAWPAGSSTDPPGRHMWRGMLPPHPTSWQVNPRVLGSCEACSHNPHRARSSLLMLGWGRLNGPWLCDGPVQPYYSTNLPVGSRQLARSLHAQARRRSINKRLGDSMLGMLKLAAARGTSFVCSCQAYLPGQDGPAALAYQLQNAWQSICSCTGL